MKALKFRQIYIIKEIYRHKSLSKAADSIGITTAAVSKSCIEFEKNYGVLLFHRAKDGMLPTSICEEIIPAIDLIQNNVHILMEKIDNSNKYRDKSVSIGFQGGACQIALFNILSALSDSFKHNIRLSCHERDTLISLIRKGELDAILIATDGLICDEELTKFYISSYRSFVVDIDKCFSFKHVISNWNIFKTRTWALPPVGFVVRKKFDEILKNNDLEFPKNIIEYNNSSSLMSIASIKEVCAIIPEYRVKDLISFRKVYGLESVIKTLKDEESMEIEYSFLFKNKQNIPKIVYRMCSLIEDNKKTLV